MLFAEYAVILTIISNVRCEEGAGYTSKSVVEALGLFGSAEFMKVMLRGLTER